MLSCMRRFSSSAPPVLAEPVADRAPARCPDVLPDDACGTAFLFLALISLLPCRSSHRLPILQDDADSAALHPLSEPPHSFLRILWHALAVEIYDAKVRYSLRTALCCRLVIQLGLRSTPQPCMCRPANSFCAPASPCSAARFSYFTASS